jgi:Phytanoyl-CoA dioxygenase (PhyH)
MGVRDEVSPLAAEAAAWAAGVFGFDDVDLVSEAAWATTCRLRRGSASAYLKRVPPGLATPFAPIVRLSRRFPHLLPEVLAADDARGWLLTADHGARTLDYDAQADDLVVVLRDYARLQAGAAEAPECLAGLPRLDLAALPERLLAFLATTQAGARGPGEVSAAYFLGDADAALFHRLLSRRLPMLRDYLAPMARLPVTLEHGDLRPPNTAVSADGHGVIIDWDDAFIGPVGMSLQGMFSGCTVPIVLLSGSAAAQAAAATPEGRMVATYVQGLADAGLADVALLREALPAALCAGNMHFILTFGRFPGEASREAAAATMHDRLTDLLNICDRVAVQDRARVLAFCDEYLAEGQGDRASALLQDRVARHADDTEALLRLAPLALRDGDHALAADVATRALQHSPDEAMLYDVLARAQGARLALGKACSTYRSGLLRQPASMLLQQGLQRMQALVRMRRQASQPQRMPVLALEPEQPAAGQPLRPEQLALGVALFNRYGTLQVDHAFPVALIERVQRAFFDRYTAYFREADHPDALFLGDRRYMLTVDVEPPFDDAALFGGGPLLPLVQAVLGDDAVLGAYTAVISLPGSHDQDLHKDHPALFPDTPWHHALPPFAVQLSIPLVPFDALTGSTRVYKGSHRAPSDEAEKLPFQDPVVPLGSCFLHDYRCLHGGRGNRSQQVRPMLSLVFNRPWLRDYKNYRQQPPLRLPDAAYAALSPELRALVRWRQIEHEVDQLDRSMLR